MLFAIFNIFIFSPGFLIHSRIHFSVHSFFLFCSSGRVMVIISLLYSFLHWSFPFVIIYSNHCSLVTIQIVITLLSLYFNPTFMMLIIYECIKTVYECAVTVELIDILSMNHVNRMFPVTASLASNNLSAIDHCFVVMSSTLI